MWYTLFMKAGCRLCPLECGADRKTNKGLCGCTDKILIAKYGLHPYEEPCISFRNGSGTIFFSGCSLRCVFCQNYTLSRAETGTETDAEGLAEIFRTLENAGADNINLVTAAHFVPQLLAAFRIYRPKIPVVYNTHGYEKPEAVRALEPYVDVWLPDLKFCSPAISARYTGKADYFFRASEAVSLMMEREPVFDNGKMLRGCIVRHLVLPLCTNDSLKIIDWFAARHSSSCFSLMGQYTPCGNIGAYPELSRKITAREYRKVTNYLLDKGLENVFIQSRTAADDAYIPDFSAEKNSLF